MNTLQTHIDHYLTYCRYQKRLDEKTLKAYRIDLTQFLSQISCTRRNKLYYYRRLHCHPSPTL